MASSRRRVLIAAGIYPPDAGGPAIHAKTQFERFPAFGFDTKVVALAHYRKQPRGIRHLIYFFSLLPKAYWCDVVYAHDALGAGIPALIASRIFGKKFVVRVGGDITWEYRVEKHPLSMNEWYKRGKYKQDRAFIFSRWLLRYTDKVIVPSELLSTLYKEYYDVDSSKISLIFNPVADTSDLESSKGHTVIFASRLVSYKNIALVLKVLAKIFPTNPELKFVVMGNGPDKNYLVSLARTLDISNNVVFKGAVTQEEVLRETAKSLFAIAPALTEFNPNYIMQCVGLRKPFLISREHGLPFVVPEELLFDPRSESELEMKILDLLNDRKYHKAEKEIQKIDFKMTWEDNLRANVDLINSLLNGSK